MRTRWVYVRKAVLFLVTWSFMSVLFSYCLRDSRAPAKTSAPFTQQMLAALKAHQHCILNATSTWSKKSIKFWTNFAGIVNECTSATAFSRVSPTMPRGSDSVHLYVLGWNESSPGVVISLGVSRNVQVERQLKQDLPIGSAFYGTDPIVEKNAGFFAVLGTYFPLKVQVQREPEETPSRHKKNKKHLAMVIDPMSFVKMMNLSKIDYLILTGGVEYDIVPLLAARRAFGDSNIIVCQVIVEFTTPTSRARFDLFANTMEDLVKSGHFVPILNVFNGYQRSLLLNFKDPFCVQKYIKDRFEISILPPQLVADIA